MDVLNTKSEGTMMKMKKWAVLLSAGVLWVLLPFTANAQFARNDEVELNRDEPLIFNSSVYRQGRKGERFQVLDYRPASRRIFLLATDSQGKDFALNVPDAAVVVVPKDPALVNEQAFAALREGRLDEAQKLMLQTSLLDRERVICAEVAMHLGRLAEAMQSYQRLVAQQPQVDADIKRLLKNAETSDRPNPLNKNDTSGQVRAAQIRQDAERVAENQRAALSQKKDIAVSEVKLLQELGIKHMSSGAIGESYDICEMALAYAARRLPERTQLSLSLSQEEAELKAKAAAARKQLDDARRHLAAKKLLTAAKAVETGLASEHGSYGLRRLQRELITRLEEVGKLHVTAMAYHGLKQYDDALKTLEKLRAVCADHEAAETLGGNLRAIISEKDARMAKAAVFEKAGRYADALETYETYGQDKDVHRLLPLYAKQREQEGDFLMAHALYEKAGQPEEMRRIESKKAEQVAEYGKARVLMVDAKFSEALAIYRRYKDARTEKEAIKQQGGYLENRGKFDDAIGIYREAGLADEVIRVKEFVNNRNDMLAQGRQQEQAANFDRAIELFQKANSQEDVRRAATVGAKLYEGKKDYQSAADYYAIAGLFDEAGRIRKEHDVTTAVRKLTDQEVFKRCSPACVTVLGESGLGSGFFVKKGGYVLTNHHVVQGATNIRIRTAAKKEYVAKVVQLSKVPDMALLKVELDEHPVLSLGDSSKVETGATASTIGSPIGRAQSYTKGNISNSDRLYRGNKCFQISVLINHGNSGGPLLDDAGQVIGICTFGEGTAAVLEDGTNIGSDVQGINYAVQINEAKRVFRDTLAF